MRFKQYISESSNIKLHIELRRNRDSVPYRSNEHTADTIIRISDKNTGEVIGEIWADKYDNNIEVVYAQFDEKYRGKGLYKRTLQLLNKNFTIISDEEYNMAVQAKKAYKSLGADFDNSERRYILRKK